MGKKQTVIVKKNIQRSPGRPKQQATTNETARTVTVNDEIGQI